MGPSVPQPSPRSSSWALLVPVKLEGGVPALSLGAAPAQCWLSQHRREAWPKGPQWSSGWGLCSAGDHVPEPHLVLAEQAVPARFLCRLCPAARLQPCSPAEGRVTLLPLSSPARCSGAVMLQGEFPSRPLPCLLPNSSPCHTQDRLQTVVVRALVLWRQGHFPTQEPAVPGPVSAKAPSSSSHGAVALPGFSSSWNISVPLRQGSPGGAEVPGSDTEPWAHPWATSLTLPFPCCFWCF